MDFQRQAENDQVGRYMSFKSPLKCPSTRNLRISPFQISSPPHPPHSPTSILHRPAPNLTMPETEDIWIQPIQIPAAPASQQSETSLSTASSELQPGISRTWKLPIIGIATPRRLSISPTSSSHSLTTLSNPGKNPISSSAIQLHEFFPRKSQTYDSSLLASRSHKTILFHVPVYFPNPPFSE